jgi:phosphate starvation-inducible membrane PsiE
MENKTKLALVIFLISFVLNYIWESLHFHLYESNTLGFSSTLSLMIYASFIDAIVINLIFLGLILIFKKFEKREKYFFIGIALMVAIFIEIRGLITNRWVYTTSMPLIFGIGLSPLIQLAITGIISIYIGGIIIKNKNGK